MRIYTLHEMIGLLRLGVWQGGMVEKLDYISPAVAEQRSQSDCGVVGEYISYDATLEWCEVSADAKSCELGISLYNPYAGEYKIYTLCSSIASRAYLWARLEEVIQDIRQAYIWSYNISKNNIFHIERKYEANYSSMRSGSIGLPRKSKIFGR